MEGFSLATPSLLFPAISLLMLAFTNRFLAISGIIRQLHDTHKKSPDLKNIAQISNLRERVVLIKWMQAAGLVSLIECLLSMLLTVLGYRTASLWVFGVSLLFMAIALVLCLWEVLVSNRALNILLSDIEQERSCESCIKRCEDCPLNTPSGNKLTELAAKLLKPR